MLQVYLSAQGELPMVKDLGFAMPPGMHSLVAIKMTQVGMGVFLYFPSNSWGLHACRKLDM